MAHDAPPHVRVRVQVRAEAVNRERVGAHEAAEMSVVVARTEVGRADLDVLFLARELVRFARAVPPVGAEVALDRAVRLERRALDELARRVVDGHARRAEMITDVQEETRRRRTGWRRELAALVEDVAGTSREVNVRLSAVTVVVAGRHDELVAIQAERREDLERVALDPQAISRALDDARAARIRVGQVPLRRARRERAAQIGE